jgi:NAD(P)-dependent dehydrogenase (short-subunit alcohol dehydrogenase family)
MKHSNKVAIITGSSRGIGKETAIALANRGYTVYATMRNPQPIHRENDQLPGNIIEAPMDVTDTHSIQALVEKVTENEGRIDLLVNNAGYGLFGLVEQVDMEEVQKQFDVNVYGIIRMMQAVLPIMRNQKGGRIINMSSISGVVSNPCLGIYSGTKHAVEAISASVASTVFPWNIKVSVIEPGPVATEFAMNVTEKSQPAVDDHYSSFVTKYREAFTQRIAEGQDPRVIGELVAHVAEEERPHFRYQTSERLENLTAKFVVDRTGDAMIKDMEAPLRAFLGSC